MAIGTVWIHGHSVEVEFPERLESLQRLSSFSRAKGSPNTINWFHFAVPTASDLQGLKVKLGSVLLRIRSGSPDAFVDAVYVYDGEERIAQFEDLRLNPQAFETIRLDPPNLPDITAGLGVSLRVVFGEEDMSHTMEFSSVGIVFTSGKMGSKAAAVSRPQSSSGRRNRHQAR